MSNDWIESGLTVMAFARRALLGFLEDVPEDKWVHQPIPGGNHTAWIVGHLASTDHYFLTTVGGAKPKLPAGWEELFGMGSVPTADQGRYPSPAELRDFLGAIREDLTGWYGQLDEAEALTPLPEDLKMFAPHVGGLGSSIAWHEGMHTGQLTVVRKSLGFAPKFG